MVAEGHPNQVIAGVLNISGWTVCTHLRRIFAKLRRLARGHGSEAAGPRQRQPSDHAAFLLSSHCTGYPARRDGLTVRTKNVRNLWAPLAPHPFADHAELDRVICYDWPRWAENTISAFPWKEQGKSPRC
jgi:hypothetical protein